MSPNARRYFGCFLPLVLAVFGCATFFLVGNAGRIVFELRPMPDDSMTPLLRPGWMVFMNNAAYWADDPRVGDIVTVETPDGWALRRIVAVPGERVEVRRGRILVDGLERDPGYNPTGTGTDAEAVTLGDGEYYVMADNREATDSRTWGPIPRSAIFGSAIFQIDDQRTFHEVMITPTPVRVDPVVTPAP